MANRSISDDLLDLPDSPPTLPQLAPQAPSEGLSLASAVASPLPELPPAPAVLEDDSNLFIDFDQIPLPARLPFPAVLPAGVARSLGLAHLQGLFPELPFPGSADHPPASDMFSDAATDNTILDPATQAAISASSPASDFASGPISTRSSVPTAAVRSSATTPGPLDSATITLIGKNELERIRAHNRILRANNVSIFKQRNEMEARAVAAERGLVVERERREKAEEAIRLGEGTVARLMREEKRRGEEIR